MGDKNYEFKFKPGDLITCFKYGSRFDKEELKEEPKEFVILNKNFNCLIIECLLHPNGSRYKIVDVFGQVSTEPKFFLETNFYKLESLNEEHYSLLFC